MNQNGVGSDLGFGNNQSLARIPSEGPKVQDGELLIQDFLNIINAQEVKINELQHELNQRESVLDECLRHVDITSRNPTHENLNIHSQTQEANLLKDELRKKDLLLQEHIQLGRQQLQEARKNFDAKLAQQRDQLAAALRSFEQKTAEQRDHHVSRTRELQTRVSEERREFARVKADLENQLAEQRGASARTKSRLENQLVVEARRHNEQMQSEIQSRARQAEQLGEQLTEKGQRINELDEQVRTQTEMVEQTRLALNRTRNELTDERRKARLATEENTVKNQQLEFVQQQCAVLEEQLRQTPVGAKEDVGKVLDDNLAQEKLIEISEKDELLDETLVGEKVEGQLSERVQCTTQ